MKVHDLAPAPGAKKARRRVGRGIGGKGGKTAGRGTKGQRARGSVARGFEGGQMPLKQRVPKLRGFNNPFRVEYQAVNLHTLADHVERTGETTVTPESLVAAGIAHKGAFIKILARGELTGEGRRARPRSLPGCPGRDHRRRWFDHDDRAPVPGRGPRRPPGCQGQPVRQPLTCCAADTAVG